MYKNKVLQFLFTLIIFKSYCLGEECDKTECPGNQKLGCTPVYQNGQCCPTYKCDGEADCRDSSDGKCDSKSTVTCKPDEFRCNSTGLCIPDQLRCDLDNDCPDGSDEHNCSNNTCDPWMFSCNDGLCIYNRWQCDGEEDCADKSDEKNCTNLSPSKNGGKITPNVQIHQN